MNDPGVAAYRGTKLMRGLIRACVISLAFWSVPAPVGAQMRASRALRSVKIDRADDGWEFELAFEFPLRYLRHTPKNSGRGLHIEFKPLRTGNSQLLMLQGPLRENLPIPKGQVNPAVEIVYDELSIGEPFVEIQFSERFDYQVTDGKQFRSLLIRATPLSAPAPSGEPDSKEAQLLSRARHAIRDGKLDLGIALLTRIVEQPEGAVSEQARMDAQELVGLTYQRRGQLAQAEAEYRAFLADYPRGPAATRVNQRLEALVTASETPRGRRREQRLRKPSSPEPAEEEPIRRELFGSMAARYFRSESLRDDSGGKFIATDVLTDVDLAGRLDADSWSVRGDFTGTYDVDVAGQGRSNDARISRLSIAVEDRIRGLRATIGRQRRSDSGVLGRFDGLHVAADIGSFVTLSALAGLPVESTSDRTPNTDTILAGGAIDVKGFWLKGLQGQLFAVGQRRASMTDRAAIGGELRYAGEKAYSFLYLDYDMAFGSLNTFLLSSTYRYSTSTDFRILVSRRNSPILTLSTALQGQTARDLKALKRQFSENQIRELALDRTAVTWSGSVGATHRLTDRLQISTDITLSQISSTKTSAGVPGNDSNGPDFTGALQLLSYDWLVKDGVGSLSMQYFEGDTSRSVMLTGYSRFTFFDNFRVIPRLRWQWRDSRLQGAQSLLRPSLETDWRYGSFLFHAQAGISWAEPVSGSSASQNVSYFLETGIRWEF